MTLNNGNLGIGTTAPGSLLHIAGSGGVYSTTPKDLFRLYNSDATATNNAVAMTFLANRTGGIATPLASISAVMTDNGATTYTGALTFSTAGTAAIPTERVRIDSAGNVGIGTTAPTSFKLQVAGDIGPEADNTYDLGSSPSARFRSLYLGPGSLHIQCTSGDGCSQGTDWAMGIPTSGAAKDSLQIGVNRSSFTSGTPTLTLNTAGNVGIGATSPLAKLDIKDSSSVATLGSEKITAAADRDFSSDTGSWTTSGTPAWKINIAASGVAAKDAPGTGAITLANAALDSAAASGNKYQITFAYTTTASSSGSLTVSFGSSNVGYAVGEAASWSESAHKQIITAAGTGALTLTPTSGWYGTIDDVSVKQLTATSGVAFRIESSDGTVSPLELRAGGSGLNNIFLGQDTGYANISGSRLVGIGVQALNSNTTGGYSVAVGYQSLQNSTTGTENAAVGYRTLSRNISGDNNSAFGSYALEYNTSGYGNAAFGSFTLNASTGSYNSGFGTWTLNSNTTGNSNTAFGYFTLGSLTTGSNNTALGQRSGNANSTGSRNVFLGFEAGYSETGSDKLYIANSRTTSPLIYGNFASSSLGINTSLNGDGALVVNQPKGTGDIFSASSSATTRFVIKNDGNVGIGTLSPALKTEIQNGVSAGSAWQQLRLSNSTDYLSGISLTRSGGSSEWYLGRYGSAGSDRFGIGVNTIIEALTILTGGNVGIGTTGPESKVQISGGGLCVGSDANCNTDNNTEGVVYASTTAMTVYDVAENYPTKDLSVGIEEVLVLDKTNGVFVKRSSGDPTEQVIGVISEKPGVLLGGFNGAQFKNDRQVAVGLSGRIPVKVTSEGGEIKIGDPLTASSIPGVAKKATKPGYVIGTAMESFSCHPELAKRPSGDSGSEIPDQVRNDSKCTGRVMFFINRVWYDPDVYITDTGDISIIANDPLSVISSEARNLTGSLTNVRDDKFQLKMGDEKVERKGLFSDLFAGNIKAGSIDAQKVTIGGKSLEEFFASISSGTASGSGVLSASDSAEQNSVILNEVKDLRDSSLKARNDIIDLKSQMASNSGRFETLETLVASTNGLLEQLLENPSLSASGSGNMNYESGIMETLTVGDSLSVTGRTTLTDLGVTGNITAGILSINGLEGTINSMGEPLKLQNLGVAGIDILNGKVIINTDGDVKATGKVTAGEIETRKLNIETASATPSAVLSTSAGTVIFEAGTIRVEVSTSALTTKSLIFTTPSFPVTVGSRRKDTDTFIIELAEPTTRDVKVSWWIIN